MFTILCLISLLVARGLASVTYLPIIILPRCDYKGKNYSIGESFQPSPCEHCQCLRSGLTCTATDCFNPTKCCPVCPNATLKQVCVHNGKTYQTGESFQPSPCEHCFCSADGRVPCAIADCFFTPCVDAIHDPTKCCPVCPNGPNCKHTDGTIIKKGDVYRPDANTDCMCPNSFIFGQPTAVCAVKPVNPVLIDPVHSD